jgi:hypothetical protein
MFTDEPTHSRGKENMAGHYTLSRPAMIRQIVPRGMLTELNERGMHNTWDIIDNEEAKTILGDKYYNDVTQGLTKDGKAGYTLDFLREPNAEPL